MSTGDRSEVMCGIRLCRTGTRFASQSTAVISPAFIRACRPLPVCSASRQYPSVNLRVRHRAVVRPREVYDMES